VNAVSYCDVLHSFFTETELSPNIIFQQDNAAAHKSWQTNQFLEDLNVRVLPWTACSPDLNAIEHVWHILGRSIQLHDL